MDRQPKGRAKQAIQVGRKIGSPLAVLVCWLFLLCPGMVLAQAQPANPVPPAASSGNRVTFAQQPAPAPASPKHPVFNLPKNECSADFWDPYAAQSLAITQSPARVQTDSASALDPADMVQQLDSDVVDPAESVQPLDSQVVQPLPRVHQLESEVVRPQNPVEQHYGERLAAVRPPDPDFPLPLPLN
jgi:hypothetical protein